MKKSIFLTLFFISLFATSQNLQPIINNYGKTFTVKNVDLLLKTNKTYKVIFDVYTDSNSPKKINKHIETVARFLNMHAAQGVPKENMKIALVLHGKATKNTLNNEYYLKEYKTKNTNLNLMDALQKAGVEIFVCGQSFEAYGYKRKHLATSVQLSLSALTALVEYQSNGYQIINFN